MNPHDIDPQQYSWWIPQFATGKIGKNGNDYDISFPDLGYDGVWVSMGGGPSIAFPFNELFFRFTPAELQAHGAVVFSTITTPVCYVRVRASSPTRTLPVTMHRYGSGVEFTNIEFNFLPFQSAYSHDVEVYSFSSTAMTIVQSFKINYKTCPVTNSDRCP